MCRVVAVGSQKGGIGKTTTAANLAVAWSELGRRVLLVDLDPQFALTRRFGLSPTALPGTTYDLLAGTAALPETALTLARGLRLAGARRELANLELALAGEHHRERFLLDALRPGAASYDLIVIDCPPNLGLLTVNAFVAANDVLVPVDMTDEGALQGAAEVRGIVDRLAQHAPVTVRALVRTKVDARRIVFQQMDDALPALGLPIARTQIPLSASFQNAAADRVVLQQARPDSAGACAYRALAQELLA
jgi:chromosome partitioning protein